VISLAGSWLKEDTDKLVRTVLFGEWKRGL